MRLSTRGLPRQHIRRAHHESRIPAVAVPDQRAGGESVVRSTGGLVCCRPAGRHRRDTVSVPAARPVVPAAQGLSRARRIDADHRDALPVVHETCDRIVRRAARWRRVAATLLEAERRDGRGHVSGCAALRRARGGARFTPARRGSPVPVRCLAADALLGGFDALDPATILTLPRPSPCFSVRGTR